MLSALVLGVAAGNYSLPPTAFAAAHGQLHGPGALTLLLLLVQTAILWHLGSELGRVQPEKLVDAIKRAREAEPADTATTSGRPNSSGRPSSSTGGDGWGRWLRCFQPPS